MSQAAVDAGIAAQIGRQTLPEAVHTIRSLSKADMKLNTYQPHMEVNPEIYEVRADGELLTCEPAVVLPGPALLPILEALSLWEESGF